MSFFLTLRTGLPGGHQFSPRYVFASFDQAFSSAECAFASKGVEYLIEDERSPGGAMARLHRERVIAKLTRIG